MRSARLDDHVLTLDDRRERPRGRVADEARAGLQVELPEVECAADRFTAHLAVDQGVPRVGARVLQPMDRAARAEEGDLPAVQRDDGAVGAAEDVEGDPMPQAA